MNAPITWTASTPTRTGRVLIGWSSAGVWVAHQGARGIAGRVYTKPRQMEGLRRRQPGMTAVLVEAWVAFDLHKSPPHIEATPVRAFARPQSEMTA